MIVVFDYLIEAFFKVIKYLFYYLLFSANISFAQWSTESGEPQFLGNGVQVQVKATSDGGVFVAWLTDLDNYHVYLQRFDAAGIAQFDEGGMLISDHENDSWIAVFHMSLGVDSENNAIITTLDQRSGPWNVYAYKISSDGTMLWGDEGVSVSNSSQINYSPRFDILSDNSIIVAWSPNSNSVEIQRISTDGSLLWGDGIIIDDINESLMSPQPIIDSNGDVLVQWIGQSGPVWAANSVLYLQKYNIDGISQWDEPTVTAGPVIFPMGNWLQQLVAGNDSRSFSAWTQISGNVQSAVSQQISDEGDIQWLGGADLSSNSNNFRMSPILSVSENSQALMAIWKESNGSQSQRGIFGQKLDNQGNQLWGPNGVSVVALNSDFDYIDLYGASFGEELISVYIQQGTNMNGDIYAKKLDAEGNLVWNGEAVAVTNSGTSKSDMMVGNGTNCLFIAWTEDGAIFAHCLRQDGTLGAPELDSFDCIADDGTEGVELWSDCYSIENTTILHLFYNEISDVIPPAIGNLINLESLILQGNDLYGVIPPEIGNLTNLIELKLEENQLTGAIPSQIGNLINLESLSLSGNNLTGEFPIELFNLVNLSGYTSPTMVGSMLHHGLNLSNNLLTGEIPPEIGNLVNLISIDFSQNQFTGQIPSEIFSLNNLESLNLSDNQFIGAVSSEISNLTNLMGIITTGHMSITTYPALDLSMNQFSGIIPSEICSLPIEWGGNMFGESEFSIDGNLFCPPYPFCIEDNIGDQDTANCEQIIDWNFSVINPVIEILGNSSQWNPGDTIAIEMELCNNTEVGHMYYPGVVLESDSNLVTIVNDSYWFYGMEADTCNNVQFIVLAMDEVITDTIVTFKAYPEALNCQNEPEYCINGDTLTFDVPIISDYVSNDTNTFIPKEFILHQNYPNPFNPITTLRYDLLENAYVRIIVYDVLGNVVSNLVSKNENSGPKSVQWNATNNQGKPVSAGVYIYSIEARGLIDTKKMILLR